MRNSNNSDSAQQLWCNSMEEACALSNPYLYLLIFHNWGKAKKRQTLPVLLVAAFPNEYKERGKVFGSVQLLPETLTGTGHTKDMLSLMGFPRKSDFPLKSAQLA